MKIGFYAGSFDPFTSGHLHVIKEASKISSRIMGIHLEGIFLNPEKKGIHNSEYFLPFASHK